MASVGVIDYGMGNLHSLGKALERAAGDQRVIISYDPKELLDCDRIVLPGVGGVRACMNELRRLELNEMVAEAARTKPLLGICLGMEVMLEWSDENDGVPALGLFPGKVVRFPDPPAVDAQANSAQAVTSAVRVPAPAPAPTLRDAVSPVPPSRLKVPHMGWNQVRQTQKHPIWNGVADNSWFYFVHSYYAAARQKKHVIGSAEYTLNFPAVIARDNLVAFQCHPEKSQGVGIQVLANFASWSP